MSLKSIKSFAILLVPTEFFNSVPVTVFANSSETSISASDSKLLSEYGIEVKSIQEDESSRVVYAIEDGIETKTTLDKLNNTVTLEITGQAPLIIDLNQSIEPTFTTFATSGEKTYSNFEYEIDLSANPRVWTIWRPQPGSFVDLYHRTITQTTSNLSNLNSFKSSVESINSLEVKFLISASLSVLSSVVTVISTALSAGVGAASLLVSLGLVGATLNYALDLNEACEDAYYWYWSV